MKNFKILIDFIIKQGFSMKLFCKIAILQERKSNSYKILILLIIILLCRTNVIYCSEIFACEELYNESEISNQLNFLDLEVLEQQLAENEVTKEIDFKQLIIDIMKGDWKISISRIFSLIGDMLFSEIRGFGDLMRSLLIISILSAILRNLTESFKNQGVGELGFYVCYMLLIMIVFQAFSVGVGIAKELIGSLRMLMEALIPLMVMMVMMAGNMGAPYVFSPTLTFMLNFTTIFINNFLVPLILLGAVMEIVNYLTEKEILTNFSKLIKSICQWMLKVIAFIFISVLALQKIASPIMSNFAGKTAKSSIGIIPVVGNVLNGAIDMVAYWADAVKSGMLVGLVIVIALICLIPILKLVATIFIFKFVSAIIQPICDERIVDCIDSIGNYSYLLLWSCVTVAIMFTLSVVILLSF